MHEKQVTWLLYQHIPKRRKCQGGRLAKLENNFNNCKLSRGRK